MSGELIPQVGIKGHFVLSPPLENLIKAQNSYECVSVRSINEIIKSGRDPFTLYYEPLGLSASTYASDSKTLLYIVALKAESGKITYVPSSYIESFPIAGGVPYENYVLAIRIGALPTDMDLSHLKRSCIDLVNDTLGTDAEARLVKVSSTSYVSVEDHEALTQARENNISIESTDRAKLLSLQLAYDRLKDQYTALADWIRDNT